ncbi:DUF1947 domain-containing protein [Desulfurococcus amylolyticus]|uniref:RNA-binding protein, containing PUA domain n=1 Tax=Desulfurococcus amylolyticus DSM 16532 TaxID=768672 RepID=I3XTI1_DESAM|nr:DUF1947 domain-containing protein [Desulfurococcus amylolyticus]AFL67255.1 RNA-binding protein, containing PUA domain [Desulfurococcus amylolyticus DSM 16532]
MKRYPLSKKDKKQFIKEFQRYGLPVSEEDLLEYYEDGGNIFILVNKTPALLKHSDQWIPCLRYLLKNPQHSITLPSIIVDKGAVQALLRGADLMVPGIRSIIGGFKAGDIVAIIDEETRRAIAIGSALIDSEVIKNGSVKKGKAVKILHHLNDEYYKAV